LKPWTFRSIREQKLLHIAGIYQARPTACRLGGAPHRLWKGAQVGTWKDKNGEKGKKERGKGEGARVKSRSERGSGASALYTLGADWSKLGHMIWTARGRVALVKVKKRRRGKADALACDVVKHGRDERHYTKLETIYRSIRLLASLGPCINDCPVRSITI